MRRRDLFTLICVSAVSWAAWARAAAQRYRIAVLFPAGSEEDWRKNPAARQFFAELGRLGEVEGENLTVEYFTGEGQVERYADLARQAAEQKPDVIVTVGTMTRALLPASGTIPIVTTFGVQPTLFPGVKSLAHPGGNLTGVSLYGGSEQHGKDLQFLKEAVPSAKRVAYLFVAKHIPAWFLSQEGDDAAKLGMALIPVGLRDGTPQEIERGFAELTRQHADAIFLDADGAFLQSARLIVRLAQENRLPTMYLVPAYIELGGLMAYTIDLEEFGRRVADDVHQILHGTKPGDIPIYLPTRFKLTINLKAAKAIGLTVPPSTLAQADEVIE
jgi:putative tryptophan/tyrosine transport system substrate-binding protein